MKNFYYCLELNLENDYIKTKLNEKLGGLLTIDSSELAVNSRFFGDTDSCFEALDRDLNSKVELLGVKQLKTGTGTLTSINETNPIHSNTPEAIEEYKKENPDYDEYLETWDDNEMMRLTFTTEEFDEERPPVITDEKAMLFRYTMVALEDEMVIPEGKTFVLGAPAAVQ